jgi:glycogen debranching enzyme
MDDTMPDEGPDDTGELRERTRAVLESAWVDEGYTAPNTHVYPWMWLWDSCFHSLVWLALGEPDRARRELTTALGTVDDAGYVPHMGYQLDPDRSVELWHRRGASSITQPPMYGHAVAELLRAGVELDPAATAAAREGLRFLLERRPREPDSGLVTVVHPWETGCDDSPRWDDLCPGGRFEVDRWRARKNELVESIERDDRGAPISNPGFPVAPVGFNALVAFNARELAAVVDAPELAAGAEELATRLDTRFDETLATWIDAGPTAAGSGRARTADSLLPLLVTRAVHDRRVAVAELLDEDAYAGPYGPRGVHIGEPTYDPDTYWRGGVWPQLAYLLWVALSRGGPDEADGAEVVRTTTIEGALRSGLAEYWDGDRATAGGAVPQSWAGLVAVLDRAGTDAAASGS